MKNILIVEDDFRLNSNISELLQAEGYNTNSASNGLEALYYINEEIPDLIISDIMMPMMDGYEFIKRIQSDSSTSSIPFLFLTAKYEASDIDLGMHLGANGYIIKPFKTTELLEIVSSHLRKKENEIHSFEEMNFDVAAKILHGLGTPLLSIFGNSDIIFDEISTLSKNEITNYIKMIRNDGKAIIKRVEKLLVYIEVERLHNSKEYEQKIKNDTFLINKEEMEQRFWNYVKNMGMGNDLIVSIENCNICIIKKYMMIIIKELLENAVKFSAPSSRIKLIGTCEEQHYKIVVIDEGGKIDKNDIDQIKEIPQFDGEDSKCDGVELGLAIVKKILKIFNGFLIIDREAHIGTTVTILIPIINQG